MKVGARDASNAGSMSDQGGRVNGDAHVSGARTGR